MIGGNTHFKNKIKINVYSICSVFRLWHNKLNMADCKDRILAFHRKSPAIKAMAE